MKPNFFIIGAPKCGTTALAKWLSDHPLVFFSALKEPHYFNVDGRRITKRLRHYERLFEGAEENQIAVGEGSTRYLYSREAVPRILDYAPDARFIVCLRNPIEMAPALHGEWKSQGYEPIRSFEKAWRIQEARARGRRVPRVIRDDPERLQYGRYCSLGWQLERLYSLVPAERVMPIVMDDLRSDPGNEYRRALAFLGLRDDGRTQFDVVNPSKRTLSPRLAVAVRQLGVLKRALGITRPLALEAAIREKNVRERPRDAISHLVIRDMKAYFAEDVGRLSELLGRDLSHWIE